MINEEAWANVKRRPDTQPKTNFRRGLPWTVVEDRDLLTRLHELDGDPNRIWILAAKHQRSHCAIVARINVLKVVARLQPKGDR